MVDLLHKHRYAVFDPPHRFTPEMPRDLNDIVCELMEKEPDKRPADGGVLFRRLDAVRRKMKRLESAPTRAAVPTGPEEGGGGPGPATMMSRLMRRELEQQNRGGPLRRLFNRPVVLLALFAIVIGALLWAFWPPSAEQLFQRGAAAAASSNPDDWDQALEDFDALDRDHPNHPHRAEVDDLRRRVAERDAARQAARETRTAGPMSEAQWFFQEGMRRRQRGDKEGARRIWTALTQAFGRTPEEAPWVDLANRELGRLDAAPAGDRQWGPVRAAVAKAKQLREAGKTDEADAVLQGLRELYRGDAEAEAIIKE